MMMMMVGDGGQDDDVWVLLLRVKMMKMTRMVVGMVEEVVVMAGMRKRVVGVRLVMATMSLMHVMMFGDGDDRYDGVRDCGSQSDGNGEWHHHGDGEDDGDDGGITLTAVIWGLPRYFVVTAMMTAMTEMREIGRAS